MTLSRRGVAWVPITFACILSIGCAITFLWSALVHDVTPYMPFISETGAEMPEAGFFSFVLFMASFFGMLTVLLRHVILVDVYDTANKWLRVTNIIGTIVGFVAFTGMAAVGAYSMNSVPAAHGAAANVLFWGMFVYEILHTGITCALYRNQCRQETRFMLIFRTVLTCLTLLSVIMMMILLPIGRSRYVKEYPGKPLAMKEPSDSGFGALVAAASFEWILGLSFVMYFLTLTPEFKTVQVDMGAQKQCFLSEQTSIVHPEPEPSTSADV